MKHTKVLLVGLLVGLITLGLLGSALIRAYVSAQLEQPLAETALQERELPINTPIMSAGFASFDDPSHPINAMNSASFHVHEFLEVYSLDAVGDQVDIGNYLYRYGNAIEAEEQAEAFVEYALKQKELQPALISSSYDANDGKGQSIRVFSPETGGIYYWFVGTKGRTLVLLAVAGLSDETTRATFDLLKSMVEQR